jgi:tRNA pseudouridine55 synthase
MLRRWKVSSKKFMKIITKKNLNDSGFDYENGNVLLIDKKPGFTSFDAVRKLMKFTGLKVGHAGTLDPYASGLLVLCTGRLTKRINEFQEAEKTYEGIIELGKRTPSMDLETGFSEEKGIEGITPAQIEEVRKSFIGNIMQYPPMFSAVKHKGKALYHYARKGVDIERVEREVNISEFTINEISLPEVHFNIVCSKGTYIRVIADDFGQKLGCGGYLKLLRRTKIGFFDVEDALTVDDLKEYFEKTGSKTG